VKVGREPFSPAVQRAIEAQNPDVTFDWDALINTPIPKPEVEEPWRERREAERRAKAAARAEAEAATRTADVEPRPDAGMEPDELVTTDSEAAAPAASSIEGVAPAGAEPQGDRRRPRRRRGRRGRRVPEAGTIAEVSGPAGHESSAAVQHTDIEESPLEAPQPEEPPESAAAKTPDENEA
jgi:hypothetical protein